MRVRACRSLTQTLARKVSMCDQVLWFEDRTAAADRALAHGVRKSCPAGPVLCHARRIYGHPCDDMTWRLVGCRRSIRPLPHPLTAMCRGVASCV
ncbi:hypothetical protein CVO74_05770 [Xanthomonas prunicola]|uniref:Uncharacterized protein n=1 Tax=Xanthomonas prunicola TaxID=2053930 RepID=A0A2N3RMH9_9XANT|nr:hypothetical protein XpruCFBP8353_00690 [Xanthomonas prunicola]PKV17959.1 hypothetical protein XpruCFBP8354_00690 [Xanthomonas prunicola]PKV22728.1 hypothetical protein CVO74_05770 [Xanthomonas prunicola]